MGQQLVVPLHEPDNSENTNSRLNRHRSRVKNNDSFPDLRCLPPEIGLKILSNVDAQELRICKAIWADLANDDLLWRRLCYSTWGYCTAYRSAKRFKDPHFWKCLFNNLEAGTDSFNTYITDSSYSSLTMLQRLRVLNDDPYDIAEFLLNTDLLKTSHVVALFRHRFDVLESYLSKHDFRGWFLPIALRSFFFKLSVCTRSLNHFVVHTLDAFSKHYCSCNPEFYEDSLLVVVHSLVLLSNDLGNPRIKNKMSKREYIKNTLQAMSTIQRGPIDVDYLGHVYDNVYLVGHVAPRRLDDV